MFARLETWFDAFFLGYAAQVSGNIAAALVPIAGALLTVWIALYGFAVMRGEASEPLSIFAWKMVKVTAILAIALPGLTYSGSVMSTAIGLQNGLAGLFVATGATAPATAFAALDAANAAANQQLQLLWRDAGMFRLDLVVASVIFSLGSTIFLVIGAFVALLGRLVMTFGLAVGPLAVLCLLFRPTARFFDSWVSFLLSAAVLSWFVFFALGMSLFVSNRVVAAIVAGGAFVPNATVIGGAVGALEASGTYLVVMLLLSIILWQAPSLASSLTGGASVQAGTQMLSNTMMVMRSGGSSKAANSSGPAGSVGRFSSPGYALGGAAASAARVATGRTPAYQQVARQGGHSS